MINTQLIRLGVPTILLALLSLAAAAQSFRVQCPTSTVTHPDPTTTSAEPASNAGPTADLMKLSILDTTQSRLVAAQMKMSLSAAGQRQPATATSRQRNMSAKALCPPSP